MSLPRSLATLVIALIFAQAVPSSAQSLRQLCRRTCGPTIASVCAGTSGHHFQGCKGVVLRTCRQRGLTACPPPAPPPNPACGPTCPAGGPAVWTGTITGSDGSTAGLVASLCMDPTTGLVVGGWSCTGPCVASGGNLQATLIGSNFTGHSEVGSSFIDPIWGCDFDGLLTGTTLNGTYRCQGYAGTFSGTWQATACP
jgi:hypothetical protein